jgi:excisionase family DNA binding protein
MKYSQQNLLAIPDFATALGVTPACIRRWLLERKIASVKVGRLVRIPADEVDRIVQDGFRPAKPPVRSEVKGNAE